MKSLIRYIPVLLFFVSCSRPGDTSGKKAQQAADSSGQSEKLVFFPVTTFLEGQIYDIKQKGVNPVRTIKQAGGQSDSTWLPVETLNTAFAEFLKPRIDSVSMVPWFSEKTFLDETIGLITMTYERKPACPDSIDLKEWTVYIDPETDRVKRIYMVKQRGAVMLQLTWLSGQYSRLLEIDESRKNGSPITKDETIHWSF